MIKKVAFTIGLFLTATYMFAQTGPGRLSGTVMDKETKELLPFANVIAYQNGVQKGLSQTDFDGKYAVTPLDAGKYKIVVTFVGYPNKVIEGVIMKSSSTTRLNFELSPDKDLQIVEVYGEKLIDVDIATVSTEISSEEIEKAPVIDVNSLISTTSSVSSTDDGGAISVAGNRPENNIYYVNGVKMTSPPGLAMSAIKELQVISGGVPAQYGDATGGIINITTKVGSERMQGSLKMETGAPFNAWNQSLAEFSLSGPIKTKTVYNDLGADIGIDTVKETVLGFFMSGRYQYAKDPRPTVTKDTNGVFRSGVYTVKEDVLNEINENPLSPSGEGYLYSAEKVDFSDLEISKARPNVSRNSVQLNGSIEYYPNKNTTVSLGGFVDYRRYHDYISGYSLMNSSNNPLNNDLDYSVYGKFRQSFGAEASDDSSTALIKNAYYQVQLDYMRSSTREEDDTHGDNYFRYGHVGNFKYSDDYVGVNDASSNYRMGIEALNENSNAVYTSAGDSLALLSNDIENAFINTTLSDDSYDFEASEYNPLAGRYISHFQELNAGDPISINQLGSSGLFANGDRAREIHGLWFGPGREFNGYTRTIEEQYRLSGSASADVGDHNITFGFEYEQRSRSSFFVSPLSLWSLAGANLNTHLSGFDLEAGPEVTIDGTDAYLTFDQKIEGNQSIFDARLREELDIADDIQINVNDLNPDDLALSFFSADDLIRNGSVAYTGYDYTGVRDRTKRSFQDFFYDTLTRYQGSFNPIYSAFYIQDKFEVNDLIMRIGLRVDRYDANQVVLKDKYSTVALNTVGETDLSSFSNGSDLTSTTIQDDWTIYVDQSSEDLNNNQDNYTVVGFRDGDDWYDASGTLVQDYAFIEGASTIANPWFTFAQDVTGREEEIFNETSLDIIGAFEDYKPQINVMPRISFSFPVNEMATFFANYDVMSQRPNPDRTRVRPVDFYFLTQNGFINNPNLKPQQQNKYQLGFKQALDEKQTVAMTISGYYQERKNEIQFTRVTNAYPASYTTFDNIDFSTVKGGEIIFDTRRMNNIKFNASYTLSFADGTGSGATTAVTLINQNFGNIKVPNALDFDQRHAFKINMDWRLDSGKGPVVLGKKIFSNFGINLQFNAGSGRPYTRLADSKSSSLIAGAFRSTLDGGINTSRLPWNYRTNLKFDKEVKIGTKSINVYCYIQNLLNTRNILNVYTQTGSPDDDGYLYESPGADQLITQSEIDLYLARLTTNNDTSFDNGNYSLPRRIRVGVSYYF